MYYSYFEDYPKEIHAKALRNVAVIKNDLCMFRKVSCQESELSRNKRDRHKYHMKSSNLDERSAGIYYTSAFDVL